MTLRAPMSGAARLARWRRIDVRRVFTGDLTLKSAAIGVAMLLWISAMRALPPPEVTAPFDGRVAVERPDVPAGYVLRADLGDVGVTLRGPEDVLEGLRAEQLRATVDLTGIVPGPEQQPAPVRVTVAAERVSVVSADPAAIQVRLERRVERTLPVQATFANAPPEGFQAGTLTFRPTQVAVIGAESLVGRVTAVLATVRFGDTPVDISQDVRPIPVDSEGRPVGGVEVDPAGVTVSVPLLSTATTRSVPVNVRLTGTPATGYWVSRVTSEPLAITVSGDRTDVEPVTAIDTAVIDVSGIAGSRTFGVGLAPPEGVSIVGTAEVRVTVTAVALVGTRPFPLVAIRTQGLGPGLAASLSPQTTSVILAGTVPALADLSGAAVIATVDVSGRGPGTYTLPVVVTAPNGTSVDVVQPESVTVTITSASASPGP